MPNLVVYGEKLTDHRQTRYFISEVLNVNSNTEIIGVI